MLETVHIVVRYLEVDTDDCTIGICCPHGELDEKREDEIASCDVRDIQQWRLVQQLQGR